MTATFTLTGQLFTKAQQPIKNAVLVIQGPPVVVDPALNRIYSQDPANVKTNEAGYVCEDGTPGVTLLVGLEYAVRSIPANALPSFKFVADNTAGAVKDIADILIEIGGGEGSDGVILLADPNSPGDYYTTGLTADITSPGDYLTDGLTAAPGSPGDYLTGAA